MNTRAGFAAIVGAPNAGKSTLTNALVGEKVSIVTHKVQTTRFQIRAIAMLETKEGDTAQVVLVDTPGIFVPKDSDRLAKSMVHAAWTGADDANLTVHVVDAPAWLRRAVGEGDAQDRLCVEDTQRVQKGLAKRKSKAFLVLNKIDEIPHDQLLTLIAEFSELNLYAEIFLVSAKNGDGVKDLSQALAEEMPKGPFLYPEDQAADIPSRLMAAEITREKLFLRLHDELPYMSMVETEGWKQKKDGSIKIDQVIYVRRDSQKPIVLGKGGQTIKDIGAAARKDMSDWLGTKVHLFLFVKVRANWKDDQARYAGTGLEFDV
ncbi:GTPase Era [Litorimonas sp. RW-G-Af-16]|uniref:GTPase Era n=1 Tax=Litorimonas sp. RW-G-Af-16 TaxID=3241168 RepID=UPI00390CD9FC